MKSVIIVLCFTLVISGCNLIDVGGPTDPPEKPTWLIHRVISEWGGDILTYEYNQYNKPIMMTHGNNPEPGMDSTIISRWYYKYDRKQRLIQAISDHDRLPGNLTPEDTITIFYDYAGRVNKMINSRYAKFGDRLIRYFTYYGDTLVNDKRPEIHAELGSFYNSKGNLILEHAVVGDSLNPEERSSSAYTSYDSHPNVSKSLNTNLSIFPPYDAWDQVTPKESANNPTKITRLSNYNGDGFTNDYKESRSYVYNSSGLVTEIKTVQQYLPGSEVGGTYTYYTKIEYVKAQ